MKKLLTRNESERLANLEKTIEKGKRTFIEVGLALAEIKCDRLFKSDFESFEEYCSKKWGFKKSYAYQMIEGAKAVKSLPDKFSTIVENPGQAREIAAIEPEKREAVLEEVVRRGPLTARNIREVSEADDDDRPRIVTHTEVMRAEQEFPPMVESPLPRCKRESDLRRWWYRNARPDRRGNFVLNLIFRMGVPVKVQSKDEMRRAFENWTSNYVEEEQQ